MGGTSFQPLTSRRRTNMAGTRSSQRLNASSSPQSAKSEGGTKRKADDSSPAGNKSKRGRPSKAAKQQKTIEQTLPASDNDNDNINVQSNESGANGEGMIQFLSPLCTYLLTRTSRHRRY